MITLNPQILHSMGIRSEESASPEYIEFTRRMNADSALPMEQRLAKIPDQKIESLLQAIQKYDWFEDPLFNEPRWTDYVMEALRRGRIDRHIASTLLLYWKKVQDDGRGNFEVLSLFEEDKAINFRAYKIIKSSLDFNRIDTFFQYRSDTAYLTKTQLNKLFAKMHDASPLQSCLFISKEKLMGAFTSINMQSRHLDSTPLQLYQSAVGTYRLTPSTLLMQNFLQVLYGNKDAIRLNLILGSSEWKEFLDVSQHDVQIPSPDELIPDDVHKFIAVKDDFTKHDMGYHALIKSGIPKEIRELYARISLSILNLEKNTPDEKTQEILCAWREMILDMDFSIFRKDLRQGILGEYYIRPDTLHSLFWNAFVKTLAKIKNGQGAAIDDLSLRSTIMQMPFDPRISAGPDGRQWSYFNDYTNFDEAFARVSPLWERRIQNNRLTEELLKIPKKDRLDHTASSC